MAATAVLLVPGAVLRVTGVLPDCSRTVLCGARRGSLTELASWHVGSAHVLFACHRSGRTWCTRTTTVQVGQAEAHSWRWMMFWVAQADPALGRDVRMGIAHSLIPMSELFDEAELWTLRDNVFFGL